MNKQLGTLLNNTETEIQIDNRFLIDLAFREVIKHFASILDDVMIRNYGTGWNTRPLGEYDMRFSNALHAHRAESNDLITILTLLSNNRILNNFAFDDRYTNWIPSFPRINRIAKRLYHSRNDWAHFDPDISNDRKTQGILNSIRNLFEIVEIQEGVERLEELLRVQAEISSAERSSRTLQSEAIINQTKQLDTALESIQEKEEESIDKLESTPESLRAFQRRVVGKYLKPETSSETHELATKFLQLHVYRSEGKYSILSETDYLKIDEILKAFLQEESLLYPGENKQDSEDYLYLSHYYNDEENLSRVFESFSFWLEAHDGF